MTAPLLLDHDRRTTTACYLYGFALAAEAPLFPSAAGVLASPVECVVEGDLAAFVSELRGDQVAEVRAQLTADDPRGTVEAIRPLLEAHDRVVGDVFFATTVLPLRFGTLLPSRAAVAGVLTGRHRAIADAIHQLEGKDELELMVTGDPAAGARERAGGTADPSTSIDAGASAAGGREYLEQKRQERELREVGRKARMRIAALVDDCARVHAVSAVLREGAKSALTPPGRELILQAAYLVARRDREVFAKELRDVLDRLAAFDVRGQLTGPWPPYSFVSLCLGEDA